jgi:hypothetical protein
MDYESESESDYKIKMDPRLMEGTPEREEYLNNTAEEYKRK